MALGDPIPFTVIARIERGKVDPGFCRLNLLLRLYQLPIHVAGDLADLEQFAGELPGDPTLDYEKAVEEWKAGDARKGLAYLLALRAKPGGEGRGRLERQKALLAFSVAAGALGRHQLSRHIADELLLEPPDPSLLVGALTQTAACWGRLGSTEVALALLDRAESHVGPGDAQKLAWICHNRASVLVKLGDHRRAERELNRAVAAYEEARDARGACRAEGVLVHIRTESGDWKGALRAAREAQEHAKKVKHERLRLLRQVDEGRILLALKETKPAIDVLNEALRAAKATEDEVCQFHAHYHLWKGYQALGNPDLADLELRAAQYHVRFLDEAQPEAEEVRKTLPARGAERPDGRRLRLVGKPKEPAGGRPRRRKGRAK
jgi:tetratricopeptide (TPR) repeat protein